MIDALEAYYNNLRNYKSQKYIVDTSSSSSSSMNDECGMSSDESYRTTGISKTSVTNQPSTSRPNVCEDNAAVANVSWQIDIKI